MLGLALVATSSLTLADTCGTAPSAPTLPDGSKATMDELVASSQDVKTYIAAADTFLDCRDAFGKGEEFKTLAPEKQAELINHSKEILDVRNAIGDAFNAEVAKYKAANPE